MLPPTSTYYLVQLIRISKFLQRNFQVLQNVFNLFNVISYIGILWCTGGPRLARFQLARSPV